MVYSADFASHPTLSTEQIFYRTVSSGTPHKIMFKSNGPKCLNYLKELSVIELHIVRWLQHAFSNGLKLSLWHLLETIHLQGSLIEAHLPVEGAHFGWVLYQVFQDVYFQLCVLVVDEPETKCEVYNKYMYLVIEIMKYALYNHQLIETVTCTQVNYCKWIHCMFVHLPEFDSFQQVSFWRSIKVAVKCIRGAKMTQGMSINKQTLQDVPCNNIY